MSIFFSMLEFTFYTVTKKYPPNPHLNPLEGGLPERAVSVQIFEYLVQGREKIRVTLSAEKTEPLSCYQFWVSLLQGS